MGEVFYFKIYMKKLLFTIIILFSVGIVAQTKVSGVVYDEFKATIPYANVCFKSNKQCVTTDENGKFYIESNSDQKIIVISYVGFKNKEITLTKAVNYNMNITFSGANALEEVKIFSGKTSKKNNPAVDILRKIWERKRKNGLQIFFNFLC